MDNYSVDWRTVGDWADGVCDLIVEIPAKEGSETPKEGTIKKILQEVKKRYKKDTNFSNYSPVLAIAYPAIFGWNKCYVIRYYLEVPEDLERRKSDELKGERITVKF